MHTRYEKYEGGGHLGAMHCHCSIAPEMECPQLGSAIRKITAACRRFCYDRSLPIAVHDILYQGKPLTTCNLTNYMGQYLSA